MNLLPFGPFLFSVSLTLLGMPLQPELAQAAVPTGWHADSLGQIAAGAVADLVVLNANPLDDIAATRDIAFVMSRGRILYPDSLRRTWSR